jgi:very-short-patch-repair endonuclease
MQRITTSQFITRSKIIHSDKYDYSESVYITAKLPITIICRLHGTFKQTPDAHLAGKGCLECGRIKTESSRLVSTTKLIEQFNVIHDNNYEYPDFIEPSIKKKPIPILCKTHGTFFQSIELHLRGCGCPSCNSSKGERIIKKILSSKDILFIEQHKFTECKHIRTLSFDFYLPDHNICIEFDGLQHFIPFSFSPDKSVETKNKNLQTIKRRDEVKNKYCMDNNITLLRIPYTTNIEQVLEFL